MLPIKPGAKTGYTGAYLTGVSSVLLADCHTLHESLEIENLGETIPVPTQVHVYTYVSPMQKAEPL